MEHITNKLNSGKTWEDLTLQEQIEICGGLDKISDRLRDALVFDTLDEIKKNEAIINS